VTSVDMFVLSHPHMYVTIKCKLNGMARTRGIFVTERAGTPFRKFLLEDASRNGVPEHFFLALV